MCRQRKISHSSGQAVLEYILIMSIMILLIFGVIYKFSDAFRQYAQQYFSSTEDGYLFCLIENAILPGDAGCDAPKFNFDAGKGKKTTPYQGSNNSTNSSSPSNSANKNSSSNSGSASSSSSDTSPGSNASRERSSTIIPSNGSDFGGRRSGSDGAPSGGNFVNGKDDEGKRDKFANLASGGSPENGSENLNSRRTGFIPVSDFQNFGTKAASTTIPTNGRDLKTAREIAAEKAAKKKADEVDSPFTFGNILRWLIILAILFILIFFVGSQFVAVQRGGKRR